MIFAIAVGGAVGSVLRRVHTFSTFSADFVSMVQDGREARAVAYAVTSVVSGVLATVSGMLVGSRLLLLRS